MLVAIDKQNFSKKPTPKETSYISRRIAKQIQNVTIRQFVKAITDGRTWCAVFSEGCRTCYNWQQQSLFAADLDDGNQSAEDLLDICDKHFIEPAILHHSFSSKPNHPKFRLIFQVAEPITDPVLAMQIQYRLVELFSGDAAVTDLARLFYGSHKQSVVHFDGSAYLNIDELRPLPDLKLQQAQLGVQARYDDDENRYTQSGIKRQLERTNKRRLSLINTVIAEQIARIAQVEEGNRYQSVFKATVRLAQFEHLLPSTIKRFVFSTIESSEAYDDWDKHDRLEKIVNDAIAFGRAHLYE